MLTIKPGQRVGELEPLTTAATLADVAVTVGAPDVSRVRYRITNERPARTLLFCADERPGEYNAAASNLLPRADAIRVYGVAVVASQKEARPFVEAIRRRVRPHCAADGCTNFAEASRFYCRMHSQSEEEETRRKVHSVGVAFLALVIGVVLGAAWEKGLPVLGAVTLAFGVGFAVERKLSAGAIEQARKETARLRRKMLQATPNVAAQEVEPMPPLVEVEQEPPPQHRRVTIPPALPPRRSVRSAGLPPRVV